MFVYSYLIFVCEIDLWTYKCHIEIVVNIAVCVHICESMYMRRMCTSVFTCTCVLKRVRTHLFLILVLTSGASNRGLVPTSKRKSASYTHKNEVHQKLQKNLFCLTNSLKKKRPTEFKFMVTTKKIYWVSACTYTYLNAFDSRV